MAKNANGVCRRAANASASSRACGFGEFRARHGLARERHRAAVRGRDPRRWRTVRGPEAEQRAAQHAGERKIVVRQQQRIGQRHQVHHRDMLGEHQPVGAGDVDVFVLERADDRLEQLAALAHQDQQSP